jgi:hypothetical protein
MYEISNMYDLWMLAKDAVELHAPGDSSSDTYYRIGAYTEPSRENFQKLYLCLLVSWRRNL